MAMEFERSPDVVALGGECTVCGRRIAASLMKVHHVQCAKKRSARKLLGCGTQPVPTPSPDRKANPSSGKCQVCGRFYGQGLMTHRASCGGYRSLSPTGSEHRRTGKIPPKPRHTQRTPAGSPSGSPSRPQNVRQRGVVSAAEACASVRYVVLGLCIGGGFFFFLRNIDVVLCCFYRSCDVNVCTVLNAKEGACHTPVRHVALGVKHPTSYVDGLQAFMDEMEERSKHLIYATTARSSSAELLVAPSVSTKGRVVHRQEEQQPLHTAVPRAAQSKIPILKAGVGKFIKVEGKSADDMLLSMISRSQIPVHVKRKTLFAKEEL